MKKLLFYFFAFFISGSVFAQNITPADMKELQKKEDSLKLLGTDILQGRNAELRMAADSQFTRILVRALQIKNSFYYPFDSIMTISKLTPEDNSFKIFTWQLPIDETLTRKHGAIQMNTKDGALKLFPLVDKSVVIDNIEDTITNNMAWVGAIYYKVIQKKAFGKTYYTLLGFDENDIKSTKKIIEILTFDKGTPVFGGGNFSFPTSEFHPQGMARYVMEFRKDASPRLVYDADMDMIVFEHLISESNEPAKKYTYIPDGDYDALKWKSGKWVYVQKIFTATTPQGQPPVPQPLRDKQGNINEAKLGQKVQQDK